MIGLKDSLYVAILMTIAGAVLSALSGGRYVHGEVLLMGSKSKMFLLEILAPVKEDRNEE